MWNRILLSKILAVRVGDGKNSDLWQRRTTIRSIAILVIQILLSLMVPKGFFNSSLHNVQFHSYIVGAYVQQEEVVFFVAVNEIKTNFDRF
jgi:hypothetical protein